jgi:hypothetical protein
MLLLSTLPEGPGRKPNEREAHLLAFFPAYFIVTAPWLLFILP